MIPKGLNEYSRVAEENLNPHRIYLIILAIHLMTKDSIVIDGKIKEEIKELFENYRKRPLNPTFSNSLIPR